MEVGSEVPSRQYVKLLDGIEGLAGAVDRLSTDGRPELIASATEFILEGLHLNRKLNREKMGEGYIYSS